MKMTVFRDVALMRLTETDQRFKGAYCHHHQRRKIPEHKSSSNTALCFSLTTLLHAPDRRMAMKKEAQTQSQHFDTGTGEQYESTSGWSVD
jgi:hypothetical protein